MARRPQRRNTQNTVTLEPTPPVEEIIPPLEKIVEEAKPKTGKVTVVLILGNGLVHPCGTRLLPNDPADVPDDGWTKAQMASGLLRAK